MSAETEPKAKEEEVLEAEIEDPSPPEEEQASAGDSQEVADLKDRLARARADYVNLQKRVERDAVLERERVKARVLEHFLAVYEYGQMAAMEAEKQPGPLAEGVKMLVREFDRMMESEGVAQIGAVGEAFDAALHEAVGEHEAEVDPGAVSRVVKPGYRLGERVLRYARVMVQPGEENPADSEQEGSTGNGDDTAADPDN